MNFFFFYLNNYSDFTLVQTGRVLRDAFKLRLSHQSGPGHGQIYPLRHGVVYALVHGEFVIAVRIIRYKPIVEHPLDTGHRFTVYFAANRQFVVVQTERWTFSWILDDWLTRELVGFEVTPQLVQESHRFGAQRCFRVKIPSYDLNINIYKKKIIVTSRWQYVSTQTCTLQLYL